MNIYSNVGWINDATWWNMMTRRHVKPYKHCINHQFWGEPTQYHAPEICRVPLASPPHFPWGLWAHAKKEPRCSTSKTYTASPSGDSSNAANCWGEPMRAQEQGTWATWDSRQKNRQSWLRGGSHPMDLRLDFPKAELRCSSRIGVSDFEPKRVGKKTFGLDGPAQEELFRRWSWCWILISISYTVFYSSSDFWISNCAWWFLEACLKHVARFGPTGLARSTLQVAFPDTSQWPLDLPELPIVSYLQWNHTHHYSNWPGKPIPTIPKYHFAPTWVEIRWQQNQPNNLKHE